MHLRTVSCAVFQWSCCCFPVLQVEGMELLVDAYHGGELTALEDAEEVLGKLIGYQVRALIDCCCSTTTSLYRHIVTAATTVGRK